MCIEVGQVQVVPNFSIKFYQILMKILFSLGNKKYFDNWYELIRFEIKCCKVLSIGFQLRKKQLEYYEEREKVWSIRKVAKILSNLSSVL